MKILRIDSDKLKEKPVKHAKPKKTYEVECVEN